MMKAFPCSCGGELILVTVTETARKIVGAKLGDRLPQEKEYYVMCSGCGKRGSNGLSPNHAICNWDIENPEGFEIPHE